GEFDGQIEPVTTKVRVIFDAKHKQQVAWSYSGMIAASGALDAYLVAILSPFGNSHFDFASFGYREFKFCAAHSRDKFNRHFALQIRGLLLTTTASSAPKNIAEDVSNPGAAAPKDVFN